MTLLCSEYSGRPIRSMEFNESTGRQLRESGAEPAAQNRFRVF